VPSTNLEDNAGAGDGRQYETQWMPEYGAEYWLAKQINQFR
jgi:hypothetical protein